MSDNYFDPPSSDSVSDDPEFDEQLAKMWLGRTWGMVGGAIVINLFSCLCNPFGLVSMLGFIAALSAALRAFRPPGVVAPHLRGRNILPGILATVFLLLSLPLTGLILLAILV